MNLQELATVKSYNIPVKVAIINNSFLGMVRQWQSCSSTGITPTDLHTNPDFVKIAEARRRGLRVTKEESCACAGRGGAPRRTLRARDPRGREENVPDDPVG